MLPRWSVANRPAVLATLRAAEALKAGVRLRRPRGRGTSPLSSPLPAATLEAQPPRLERPLPSAPLGVCPAPELLPSTSSRRHLSNYTYSNRCARAPELPCSSTRLFRRLVSAAVRVRRPHGPVYGRGEAYAPFETWKRATGERCEWRIDWDRPGRRRRSRATPSG